MTPKLNAEILVSVLTFLASFLVTAWILQGDLRRRKIRADAFAVTAIAFLGGFAFNFLAINAGLSWAGQLLGEILALVILAWRKKISVLELLDAFSPATAAGYSVLQLAHFISYASQHSADAQRGILLTALFKLIVWTVITAFLWRMSKKAALGPKAAGEIFCFYLLFGGGSPFVFGLVSAV